MTSDCQLLANRQTAAEVAVRAVRLADLRASRNALRHGLAAITCCSPVRTGTVERLARAICGDENDKRLFEAAVAVAENCLVRRAIKEQQVAVIERLRDKTAIALAKGDNSFSLGKARFLEIVARQQGDRGPSPKIARKIQRLLRRSA